MVDHVDHHGDCRYEMVDHVDHHCECRHADNVLSTVDVSTAFFQTQNNLFVVVPGEVIGVVELINVFLHLTDLVLHQRNSRLGRFELRGQFLDPYHFKKYVPGVKLLNTTAISFVGFFVHVDNHPLRIPVVEAIMKTYT